MITNYDSTGILLIEVSETFLLMWMHTHIQTYQHTDSTHIQYETCIGYDGQEKTVNIK